MNEALGRKQMNPLGWELAFFIGVIIMTAIVFALLGSLRRFRAIRVFLAFTTAYLVLFAPVVCCFWIDPQCRLNFAEPIIIALLAALFLLATRWFPGTLAIIGAAFHFSFMYWNLTLDTGGVFTLLLGIGFLTCIVWGTWYRRCFGR